jgi:serine/threonine protein kinase
MSEIAAYVHSKNVIHRDMHFGNWMISDGKIYLLDLGTSLILENGIVDPSHDRFWHFWPWFNPPEANFGKPHTYNQDVFIIGACFSFMNHDENWRAFKVPFDMEVEGKKTRDENGHPLKELYYGTLDNIKTPKFERYGPEFETLWNSMLAYDPKDRPSAAEVHRLSLKLK